MKLETLSTILAQTKIKKGGRAERAAVLYFVEGQKSKTKIAKEIGTSLAFVSKTIKNIIAAHKNMKRVPMNYVPYTIFLPDDDEIKRQVENFAAIIIKMREVEIIRGGGNAKI